MHWKKLVEGHRLYLEQEPLDEKYFSFETLPDCTDLSVAQRLIAFINSWRTRTPMSPEILSKALGGVRADLELLCAYRIDSLILELQLANGKTIAETVATVFNAIAKCGSRTESTGASKILHSLLPQLFVMWDMRIQGGYGLARDATQQRPIGEEYVKTFLPRVMDELKEAIQTFSRENNRERAEAIEELEAQCGGRTLAKLLDEYNYAKFTLSLDELWQRF